MFYLLIRINNIKMFGFILSKIYSLIFVDNNLLNRLIMNLTRLLLTALVVIVGAFSAMAQDVISINAEHLNNEQKSTLQYAKKTLKAQDNKVMLPLEINALLGDTIAPEPYRATPVWNDAYFVSDTTFEASLIIPLKVATNNGELFSELKILGVDKYTFCRVVTTPISFLENDSLSYRININSNLIGILLVASVYENDVFKGQVMGVSDSYGVVDGTYQSNYNFDTEIYRRYHTNYKHVQHYYKYHRDTRIFYHNLINKVMNVQLQKHPLKIGFR